MDWFTWSYVFLVRMHPFMTGAGCALSIMAALQFLRFYRRTHDRLFLFFSASFGMMGLNRAILIVVSSASEEHTWVYIVRLIAFCLILYAIIDKNRVRRG